MIPTSNGHARYRQLIVKYTLDWTGPSHSLVHLLRHLRRTHDITVLLPGTGPLNDAFDEDIRIVTLPSLDAHAIPAMVRTMRRERARLVYANNTAGSSRNACIAAHLAGLPFVCHVRGMGWRKSWSRLGYLRLSDAVIAVSEACAESVRRFARPGRLHVVYNGVPAEGEEPGSTGTSDDGARTALRAELGLTADAQIILGVAHVCSRKGQMHAVNAFARIAADFPAAHLLLAGALTREADYVELVRGAAREAGLDARIHLLGFRSDVGGLYRAADVFLHTAVVDPQPRSVLEAMAAELPVVAFAVDGVAETVVDGTTGHLVRSGDSAGLAHALGELLRDREGRQR
ncbi:MAG: glycosyltransferase family 4 protein, partial [Longimicrobiales bacterium]